MQVNRAATMHPETVRPSDSLFEVARKMKSCQVGFLPVVNEQFQPVGIITDRDLVVRGMAEGRSPILAHAKDVMSEPTGWIFEDTEIDDAVQQMVRKGLRRLLVKAHNGTLSGVLSIDDLAVFTQGDETAGRVLQTIAERTAVAH